MASRRPVRSCWGLGWGVLPDGVFCGGREESGRRWPFVPFWIRGRTGDAPDVVWQKGALHGASCPLTGDGRSAQHVSHLGSQRLDVQFLIFREALGFGAEPLERGLQRRVLTSAPDEAVARVPERVHLACPASLPFVAKRVDGRPVPRGDSWPGRELSSRRTRPGSPCAHRGWRPPGAAPVSSWP